MPSRNKGAVSRSRPPRLVNVEKDASLFVYRLPCVVELAASPFRACTEQSVEYLISKVFLVGEDYFFGLLIKRLQGVCFVHMYILYRF